MYKFANRLLITFLVVVSVAIKAEEKTHELNEPIKPLPVKIDVDKAKAALGQRLFNDPRLSGDNTLSCASCHNIYLKAGADSMSLPTGFNGIKGEVNTPTVFNAVFNFRQFWNGRANNLHEQIDGVVHNPKEFNTNWDEIISKLSPDSELNILFKKEYKNNINQDDIIDALVEYEKTLITPRSRFDRYLRGESNILSKDELYGYTLFKSYGCVSCHQGVNVGGNMFQKLGVFEPYYNKSNSDEFDYGRFSVTGRKSDMYVYKVPGLRNVVKTAPYFHDGHITRLEVAVDTMARYQLGINLKSAENKAIISFLETLTGEFDGVPVE